MKRARHSNRKGVSKRWPKLYRKGGRFCWTKRMLAEADRMAKELLAGLRIE